MSARSPLFGREADVQAALGALGQARLVSVVGPPGAGKTSLAREVERRLGAAGRSVRWVALRPCRDAGEALARLLLAAGAGAQAADEAQALAALSERLEGEVLVLDELEHLADELAAPLSDLLDATEHLALLVTSRVRLGVGGEVVRALGPLDDEAAQALLRDRLARLGAAAPEPAQAARLVAHVDRLPLGIELVASRAAALGSAALLARLDADPRRALALDPLRRALDGSWALLGPDDRRAFAGCAVFRGGFALDAAEAALAPLGVGPVADRIEALHRASLVALCEGPDGPRHEMPTVVEAYAAARFDELDGREQVAAAHAAHYAALAAADEARRARLGAERSNLLAAFEHLASRDPASAARVALALDPLLVTLGPVALHRSVLERACALAEGVGDPALASSLLQALARHLVLRGSASAIEMAERAAACGEAAGDPERVGAALSLLAFALRAHGRLDDAQQAASRARALAGGDARQGAMAEQVLGLVAFARRDLAASQEHLRRALALARSASATRLEAIILANLARALREAGDAAAARASLAEAEALFVAIQDRFHLARIAPSWAAIERLEGNLDGAEARLHAALGPIREQGAGEGEVEQRLELARVALARGDGALAGAWADEAAALARRLGDGNSFAASLAELRRDLACASSPARRLSLDREARLVEIDGLRLDLSRRGPLRRIVLALAEHGPLRALSVHDLREAGWPGERMRPESAAARVYMAIRRLRALGLAPALRTRDDGYLLDAEIRWRAE